MFELIIIVLSFLVDAFLVLKFLDFILDHILLVIAIIVVLLLIRMIVRKCRKTVNKGKAYYNLIDDLFFRRKKDNSGRDSKNTKP